MDLLIQYCTGKYYINNKQLDLLILLKCSTISIIVRSENHPLHFQLYPWYDIIYFLQNQGKQRNDFVFIRERSGSYKMFVRCIADVKLSGFKIRFPACDCLVKKKVLFPLAVGCAHVSQIQCYIW